MDQKSWLWPRKRCSEKTIVSISKSDHPAQVNGVEGQTVPNEKEIFLEQSLKILDEKLATALSESNSKDEQLIWSAEMEQVAIADASLGQKKAEAEVLCLKKELDEAVVWREAANESIMHLNTALRDHIQKLTSLREEQEQKVRDAVMRTSKEFEMVHKKLEDRLAETSKRITNLTHENSHLNKVLLVKGKIIEDLTKSSTQAEAEFNALMSRLDSVEKENSFLRYEFQMLEREFHIRNEEMEFSRRSLDASHKQQLENVKKIRKLEAECQRLRLLSRKRLPGQVALTKVKNDIEMQEKTVIRRRKSDPPTGSLILKDTAKGDIHHKEITFLVERMCNLEGENKALKDLLGRKEVDICHSSVKGSKELALASPLSNETSSISSYHTCKRDESVCSKMIEVSEMCLMDDFAEMEKLAIVAVDSTIGSSYPPSDASLALSDSSRIETHGIDSTGKELVKVEQHDLYELGVEVQGQDSLSKRSSNWLHEILKILMEQSRVSKKGTDELIEDIRVALHNVTPPYIGPSELLLISGYITWKSPVTSPKMQSLTIEPGSSQSVTSELEKIHSLLQAENERLKAEINSMKSSNKDVQVKLQVVKNKSENLESELQQSQQSFASLRAELEEAKESKRMMEDLMENQKSINEDIDTQLTVTKVKLNETLQKLSSLEVELEDRSHCCEELEGTCLELQLQLESITANPTSVDNMDQEKGPQKTDWEITSASAKLAECQETILNLGKQIKALALPKENTVGATNGSIKNMRKHMSLLDRMLSEDGVQKEKLNSPNLEKPLSTIDTVHASLSPQSEAKSPIMGTMVILPTKKRGGMNFLRKLLLRKKRERSKKRAFPLRIEPY